MFIFFGLAAMVLFFAGVALGHFANGEGCGLDGVGSTREQVSNGLPFFYVFSHLLP